MKLPFWVIATSVTAQLKLFPLNQLPYAIPIPQVDPIVGDCVGPHWTPPSSRSAPRIAIIGAGAAGTSAAFFLAHFGQEALLTTDITLFEASPIIGGRAQRITPWEENATTVSADEPVEAGASIFVTANKNLLKAVKTFNLTTKAHQGENGAMGIWNGQEFIYTESDSFGWGFSYIKLWWRYGRSPLRVKSLVAENIAKFQHVYTPQFVQAGPYGSISEIIEQLGVGNLVNTTTRATFSAEGVVELFTNELVEAATRVNYGQSSGEISAFAGVVSLAATGALSVQGGNKRIFESFLAASKATVRLSDRVTELVKLDRGDVERAQWVVRSTNGGGTFDAVILATPHALSNIPILNSRAAAKIPRQRYVHLHVTFVITNATTPQSHYFGLAEGAIVPNSIYSTFASETSDVKPVFNSISYLQALSPNVSALHGLGTAHVVKIFSPKKLEAGLLGEIFGPANVLKVVRKEWDAYPVIDPVADAKEWAQIRLDQSLYYVSGFERFISCMETETIAASNVVALLLQDFFGYRATKSWAEWDAPSP